MVLIGNFLKVLVYLLDFNTGIFNHFPNYVYFKYQYSLANIQGSVYKSLKIVLDFINWKKNDTLTVRFKGNSLYFTGLFTLIRNKKIELVMIHNSSKGLFQV